MEKKITWLHFTDLHYGQKGQNILWPKIKKELFRDFEFIKSELGKIDIVFFSGDLTQSGKKEEFDELTALLKEMWSHFNKIGSDPLLIAIPGNHDLNRPDQKKAVVKVLKNYQNDKELKENFWSGINEKNENYDLIEECFRNFTVWYEEISLPKPKLTFGLIPGDISADIIVNEINIKIVGLNTAFLELSNDDYLKKLIISPEQVIALTSPNPLDWVEKADIALLITHHDVSWYDEQSTEYYENDINPGNTFYNHLCGHLHKANAFESGILGSELRRIQLGPSLFGLQKINNSLDRIHGYYAGSYVFKHAEIYERFYPRKAQQQYDGSYGIVPDNGFKLQNKPYLELTFSRKRNFREDEVSNGNGIPKIELVSEIATEDRLDIIGRKNILELKVDKEDEKELDGIPQINYISLPQHSNIRLVEQRNFIQFIQEDRFGWLITDWGLEEAGFIGSISEKLGLNKHKNAYILNCEDIINEAELISAFDNQFGMALQQFCSLTSRLKNRLLVLDHVDIALYSNANSCYKFLEIIKSIIDFCPGLYVIVVCRQTPKQILNERSVKLFPLDASDVRSYLDHHVSGTFSELDSAENLVKLLDITSGLPKHIDREIESLKVASFEEILEAERESQIDIASVDQIPKSLKQAIGSLDDSKDKVKERGFRLLKILTVLYNGETAANLKRFDGPNPIRIESANLLEQLSLIEVITTNKVLSRVANSTFQQIKLLRVPRQIRDYVNTLITDDERDSILKLACDMYFGRKWRSGSIKDIYSSVFGVYNFLNVDNCHVITNNLMGNAIKKDDAFEIERAANLAINFCDHIHDHGDYKNAVNISEEIYNWLKPTNFSRLKGRNAILYGAALRMSGNADKSTLILNEALQIDEANFSNDEKNSILFDLAFTYVNQQKFEKAIECSKIIEKVAIPKSAHYVQAKYIQASSTLKGSELIQKLKSLEENAKKAKSEQLANTISLEISRLENDDTQKEKRYSKIMASEKDDYNKLRAIINRSFIRIENGQTISDEDLYFLNICYSYLYTQRLEALFNKCHKTLWKYCIKEKRIEDLFNLFKHSSLIWRISDETELEKKYFTDLKSEAQGHMTSLTSDPINVANIGYYRKRELELDSH